MFNHYAVIIFRLFVGYPYRTEEALFVHTFYGHARLYCFNGIIC